MTQGPGLVGSLLVGLSFAKSLAWARGVPARAGPPSGRPHRVARARKRRDAAAGGRARRLGRSHQPVSRSRRRASTSCSGGRGTTRRVRRTTRWPSCSASVSGRAGRSIVWRATATIARCSFPKTRLTHADRNAPHSAGTPRLQLQRPEDVGAAPRHGCGERRSACAPPSPLPQHEMADICASFQRVVVETLLDRLFEAARWLRRAERRDRRRRVGQQPAARRRHRARPAREPPGVHPEPGAVDRQRRDDCRRRAAAASHGADDPSRREREPAWRCNCRRAAWRT